MKKWMNKRSFSVAGMWMIIGLLCTGCLTQNIVVVVEPDGSGNIAITRAMSSSFLAEITRQFEQMQAGFGAGAEVNIDLPFDPANPLYNRETLERMASMYGSGVTFVNARPVDRAGTKGVQVMYAFEDINDVQINPNIVLPMAMLFGGDSDVDVMSEMPSMEEVQFNFESSDTGNRLQVLLPSGMRDVDQRRERLRQKADTAATEPEEEIEDIPPHMDMSAGMGHPGASMFGMTGNETSEEVMRAMFAGTRMSLAVEVRGEVTETTAQYPTERRPTRFMLYDINFDRAMSHAKFRHAAEDLDALESAHAPDDFMNVFYALPTATVENQSELTIYFQ